MESIVFDTLSNVGSALGIPAVIIAVWVIFEVRTLKERSRRWKCYELDRCNWMLPFFASEEDKVVIDCTNHDERSWFEYLADFYDYRKILIYVDTDVDTCLQRRDHLDREYIQEVHDGCERMWDMRYEFFDKAMRISA